MSLPWKPSRRNEPYSFCLIQGPHCHSLQFTLRGLQGKECFEIEDKTVVRAGCRVFVASSQWREVQRFMPDFLHGKPSHVHRIAECRAQTSGSICPKARWRLNVDLITQGDTCLHPSTWMTPLFSEKSVCGPESFNEVPTWLINKWH